MDEGFGQGERAANTLAELPNVGKIVTSANDPVSDVGLLMHITTMKVKIFESDSPIGEAEIFALDSPMGVAIAKFIPLPAYNVAQHANVVDGDYIDDRGDKLRIEMTNGVALTSQAISIQDWPTLGEHELHILGVLEPSFDELFSDHPHYRDYYDLDLTDEERAKKQRRLTAKARRRSVKAWLVISAIVASIASAIVFTT